MVQLRRIPLETMSVASTASLVSRWRLGRRTNEFIHSPVALSTDLDFVNEICLFFCYFSFVFSTFFDSDGNESIRVVEALLYELDSTGFN